MKKLEQSVTGLADILRGFREERGLVRRGYSLGGPCTTTGVAVLVLSPGGPAWSQAAEHGERAQLSALWFGQ